MSSDDLYDELDTVRYSPKHGFRKIEDPVVRETSLRVFVNDLEVVVIQSLKHEIRELALGFLYTECVINDVSAVKEIEVNDGLHAVKVITSEKITQGNIPSVRSITSGCGAEVSFINPMQSNLFKILQSKETLRVEVISKLMRKLMKASKLFTETGAVHIAAFSDGEKLIHVSEDIGRHNCIDKIIGWKLLNNKSSSHLRLILASGRLSSDIVAKSIRGGVPIVVSHSAPTRGAIQLAKDFGITLIGFARGSRFNIYSHEERIVQ